MHTIAPFLPPIALALIDKLEFWLGSTLRPSRVHGEMNALYGPI